MSRSYFLFNTKARDFVRTSTLPTGLPRDVTWVLALHSFPASAGFKVVTSHSLSTLTPERAVQQGCEGLG